MSKPKIKHHKGCFRKFGANWCDCEVIQKLDNILNKFKKLKRAKK